jgi:hypothetical protein
MSEWLSVSLRKDLDELLRKIMLPDHPQNAPSDSEKRRSVLVIAATIPGLRMCERRRCIQLAQSAPPVELATLAEVLGQMNNSFNNFWPRLKAQHETILGRCRDRLAELDRYATLLEASYARRAEGRSVLDLLEGTSLSSVSMSMPFEPLFPFLGYEVEAILVPLREIKFPSVLIKNSGRFRR